MSRSLDKLMASFLALLVASLPLQGAVVSLAASASSHGEDMRHVASHAEHSRAMHGAKEMDDTCDCCIDGACQMGSFCQGSQCGSCGLAIVAPSGFPENIADSIQAAEIPRPAPRPPAVLFRPPRV